MNKLVLVLALTLPLYAQHDRHDMPKADPDQRDPHAAAAADQQMDHHHMDMGPHMKLTPVRAATEADQQRAAEIVRQTRGAIEKYTDVKVAERDGYKQFAPNLKQQKMYHYTNYRYAMLAAFRFDPERPTSLLYQDDGRGGMKLIGAMFTAPKNAAPETLEQRVPLSIAQWHAHVNLCLPPKERRAEMFAQNPRFGLQGSITTKSECETAGGKFMPQIFGWMVHLYPWESDPQQVWSLEKQMDHGH